MSGINYKYNAINQKELLEIIDKVEDFSKRNKEFESRILECLSDLKESIDINGKKFSNKDDIVQNNFLLYQSNSSSYIKVFTSIINNYETAVEDSVNYINSK